MQSRLWTANFFLRTFFLNKVFPKIFGEQVPTRDGLFLSLDGQ